MAPVPWPEYSFETTLNTLTEDLFLKVHSVDYRENNSAFSSVCVASRPDIIAPGNPVLYYANPTQYGVHLEWVFSTSDDIAEHRVQAKNQEELVWTSLLVFDASNTPTTSGWDNQLTLTGSGGQLYDTTASHLNIYDYRVLALDDDGNVSSSVIISVRPYDSGLRGVIYNLAADALSDPEAVEENNLSAPAVELTWDYDELEGLFNFQIFRSVDNQPMKAYATTNGRDGYNFSDAYYEEQGSSSIPPGSFAWIDLELGVPIGDNNSAWEEQGGSASNTRTFTYRVMARHYDGGFSPMSEEVSVVVDISGE